MKAWAERFYASKVWKDCREAFLQSKGFLCERCSETTNPMPAKIAHHKTHLTPENINDPHVSLSWSNLESLCQDCHNKEHHGSSETTRYIFGKNGEVIPI